MNADDFYTDLRQRGIRLRLDADGETLRVSPAALLTPEDRAAIKAHRSELRAIVALACVWAVLTAAGARWKRRRMPEDSEDFATALRAYEVLTTALGGERRTEQLALLGSGA